MYWAQAMVKSTRGLIRGLFFTALFCCSLFRSGTVLAFDPASEEAIAIESDSAVLNDASGLSSYQGNVIVTQGQSRLEADTLNVQTKDREIISIEAIGSPANFIQQLDANSVATKGYADSIVYRISNAMLELRGNANLTQDGNSFSGELIEYDLSRKAIKASGDQEEGRRVKIEYKPRPQQATEADSEPDNSDPTSADTE